MWEGEHLTPQITAPSRANVACAHDGILDLRRAQPVATDVDDVVHPPRDLVMASLGPVSSVSREVVACNPVGNSDQHLPTRTQQSSHPSFADTVRLCSSQALQKEALKPCALPASCLLALPAGGTVCCAVWLCASERADGPDTTECNQDCKRLGSRRHTRSALNFPQK